MKEIKKAEELVAAAERQGVELLAVEADVVLGYLEGHDFLLMLKDDFTMILHDLSPEDSSEADTESTLRGVVEFCREMNSELLEGYAVGDPFYLLELQKDELILEGMMKKVEVVNPLAIRYYDVRITETLERVVRVEAASGSEAARKVRDAWKDGEYILGADDFTGVEITSVD